MSLVNQVLKDLQDNQHYVKPLVLHPPVKQSSYMFKIALSLFAFFIIATFLFPFKESISTNHEKLSELKAVGKEKSDEQLISQGVTGIYTPVPSLVQNEVTMKSPVVGVNVNKGKRLNPKSIKKDKFNKEEKIHEIKTERNFVEKENKKKLQLSKKVKSYSYKTRLKKMLFEIKQNRPFLGFQKTKQQLIQLINDHPNYHNARTYLIQLLWQENDRDVINLLANSIDSYPNESFYRLSAARYYLSRSQNDLAIKYLTELPEQLSFDKDIIQTRAIIRQKQNKHQLAIDDYKNLANHHSINGSIYLAMGISFEALGNEQMAESSYRHAIQDSSLSLQHKAFLNKKLLKNKRKSLNQRNYGKRK